MALIAAADGSYQMGYIDALFQAITHRNKDISQLAKRLAKNFVHHWWRHVNQRQLAQVEIYESVRVPIAAALRPRFDELRNGLAMRKGSIAIALA